MDKNSPFQTYDDRSDAATVRAAPGRLARRTGQARAGRLCRAPFRRASGRISARQRRAAGLADRLHRLGRRGGGAEGQGGDLRRWPLHAAGRAPRPTPSCSSRATWWRKDRRAGFPITCRKAPSWATTPGSPPPMAWQACARRRRRRAAALVACDSNPIDAVWTDQPAAAHGQSRAACLQSGGRRQPKPSAPASPRA